MTRHAERVPWHAVEIGQAIYDPRWGGWRLLSKDDSPLAGLVVVIASTAPNDQRVMRSKVDRNYMVTVIEP